MFSEAVTRPTGRIRPGSRGALNLPDVFSNAKPAQPLSSASVRESCWTSTSELCTGGGTQHRPPLHDEHGYTVHEATLLAADLISQGVDARRLLKEYTSYDTVGNAYFTLMSHAIPAKWSRVAVVTSDFHMPRSRALYSDIFSLGSAHLPDPYRAAITQPPANVLPPRFLLEFFAAPDEGALSPEVLKARRMREATSLAEWKQNFAKIDCLADFHRWLYATHKCYAVARQHEFAVSDIGDLDRQTY